MRKAGDSKSAWSRSLEMRKITYWAPESIPCH
jgi:hypothetical protein